MNTNWLVKAKNEIIIMTNKKIYCGCFLEAKKTYG